MTVWNAIVQKSRLVRRSFSTSELKCLSTSGVHTDWKIHFDKPKVDIHKHHQLTVVV